MGNFKLKIILPVLLVLPGILTAQATPDSDAAAIATENPAETAPDAMPTMAEIEQAYQRGDFVFVRKGLERQAKEVGTPLAQYRYGRVLLEGKGGPRDMMKARDWLEKAVDQNHAEAATLLGRIYVSGQDGDPLYQPERAVELFANAAARGQTDAQFYLAKLYLSGLGTPADPKQAFNWFLAAAEGGNVQAQYELSKAYSRGRGTKLNTEEAVRWLRSAAEEGHTEAQFFLSVALDTGNGMAQNKSAAVDWLRRSAENGMIVAQRALGLKYVIGETVEPNADEALRWLTLAAKRGDTQATFELGKAYLAGNTLPADPGRAWNWFQRASDDDFGPATAAMARMADQGIGDVPDLEKAVRLYRKALAQGDSSVALRLGHLAGAGKLDGLAAPHYAVPWAMVAAQDGDMAALDWVRMQADQGVRPAQTALAKWYLDSGENLLQAAELFETAGRAGDVEAQFHLGMMLTRGQGLEQDYVQAHKWLNIAAASGYGEAAKMRGVISDLMTAEQIAEAQRMARAYFEEIRNMSSDEVKK
ncbi:tetratricopeptide repeat protein [Thalassovita sp.]|uniref:SEL1-like repeat protein n=1 Tax=Thalassovita sp. TaxID=1979401 RepID=UPI002B2686BE|nr:tetratricopeptide repeat protein [Thalassovita sp.]